MGAPPIAGRTGSPIGPEERAEYARVVEEALRSGALGEALRGAPPAAAERLRSWAHEAVDDLWAQAAAEYREWCRARAAGNSQEGAPGAAPRAAAGPGGDLVAALAVLVPLTAGAAAVIFLVLGYLLMLVGVQQAAGASLVVTGWAGAGVAAVTASLGLGRLAVTARRRSGPARRSAAEEAAHAAWRAALLERAVLPYLHHRLLDAADPGAPAGSERAGSRGPAGPRFVSPGFDSPGFGGPATGQ
ncbi:hypothetical protein [Streptomyces qinglanensis]|uniref:Transmembrane protein n=2 Tax=Streptomyces qinglanensis TaxID=943816 RepID=A0A1H9R219_9ACTN|nr:hypothetical protein [Streptomyces qinglanensis]SER66786.1 hypothetical protein SAMN05421870_103266 [Streptomyces qinglanensis]